MKTVLYFLAVLLIISTLTYPQADYVLFSRGLVGGTDADIYQMNSDGSNIQLVYNDAGYCQAVDLSANGTKIIFSSSASTTSKQEVFIMNAFSTTAQQITTNNDTYGSSYPRFYGSTKIWYDRGPTAGVHEWWEMNYDGSGQVQITNWLTGGRAAPFFHFNNNQTKVVYEKGFSSAASTNEIYTANINLTNELQLTNNSIFDGRPKFSLDGLKVVWSEENAGAINIWIMNSDGTSKTQLTNVANGKSCWYASFSSDGSRIYYAYYDGTQSDIYRMNSDGTSQTNITNTPTMDETPWYVGPGPTPVELVSFTSNVNGNNVILSWSTASETNNSGFQVERKSTNEEYKTIGFIQGKGTTTEIQDYKFVDNGLGDGKYSYRLKQIDFDGTFEYSPTINVGIGLPSEFPLSQNYPNPFNPKTNIQFSLPISGKVTLKVFDLLGNEIKTLLNEEKPNGSYEVEFDASSLPSGFYIYQIKSGNFLEVKKMILLK